MKYDSIAVGVSPEAPFCVGNTLGTQCLCGIRAGGLFMCRKCDEVRMCRKRGCTPTFVELKEIWLLPHPSLDVTPVFLHLL